MALRKRGNFLNLLQKEGGTQKMGVPSEKGGGGVPTLEETMELVFPVRRVTSRA